MQISDQIDDVLCRHRGLYYNSKNNTLEGELFLPDGDGYSIYMELDLYPRFFPTVYETGGRIPHKMDRHIYPDSGSCCFTTRAKSQVLLKTSIKSLLEFIDEIVVRYFENNSYYEINKKYFSDEYSHGDNGIIEGYKDILGINDTIKAARLILQAAKAPKLKIHQDCYCGSGKRLRKCKNGSHLNQLRQLYLIDKDVLKNDMLAFKDAIDTYMTENQD
ncbi:hypothetical protein [Mangrovimonas sp. YM274]|uniref:hypothetical protein n=1 Tax=Mangrovimonas sp. YM274 TaxID=3070660 RepID=UPI0027DD5EBA|nr:hypothetical protein [Mangrovimonas sp. YM274]WMI70080.1 hypothetical protein RBH95_06950 [Mangrovimonas sp. YM274]